MQRFQRGQNLYPFHPRVTWEYEQILLKFHLTLFLIILLSTVM
jgi:hypothetical protein